MTRKIIRAGNYRESSKSKKRGKHNMETPAIKEPGAEKIPADMIVQNLLLTSLLSSPFNPRGKYSRDPEKLKELAADIKVHGVQQAILVRPDGAGKYEIVFGTRRVEASKIAGKETVPAVVRELSAEEAMTLAMVENLQRTDIHFKDMMKKGRHKPLPKRWGVGSRPGPAKEAKVR
jgi:hypothetical protein